MTDEQIRQNADAYAGQFLEPYDEEYAPIKYVTAQMAHIAGAHSRDEEIGRMNTTIRLYANQIAQLRKEIEQLRNPWISVEDRLPETGADIIYLMNSGTPGRNERYRKFDAEWFRMNVRHWQYANDPELKKGE